MYVKGFGLVGHKGIHVHRWFRFRVEALLLVGRKEGGD